jgi:hypothetical protein
VIINRSEYVQDYNEIWADLNYVKKRVKHLSNENLINEIYNYLDLDGLPRLNQIVNDWDFMNDENLSREDREELEQIFSLLYARGIRL